MNLAIKLTLAAAGLFLFVGLLGGPTNQFRERNFNTAWGMALLIVGELGGIGAIVWGFIVTQFLA